MAQEPKELTALVIEDDESLRIPIVRYLGRQGLKVDAVETTQEGLDILAKEAYDLVITDLNQQPTGVEVYQAAVAKGMNAYIRTGGAKPELLEQAKEIAGDKLYSGTIQLSDLGHMINETRQQQRPPQ